MVLDELHGPFAADLPDHLGVAVEDVDPDLVDAGVLGHVQALGLEQALLGQVQLERVDHAARHARGPDVFLEAAHGLADGLGIAPVAGHGRLERDAGPAPIDRRLGLAEGIGGRGAQQREEQHRQGQPRQGAGAARQARQAAPDGARAAAGAGPRRHAAQQGQAAGTLGVARVAQHGALEELGQEHQGRPGRQARQAAGREQQLAARLVLAVAGVVAQHGLDPLVAVALQVGLGPPVDEGLGPAQADGLGHLGAVGTGLDLDLVDVGVGRDAELAGVEHAVQGVGADPMGQHPVGALRVVEPRGRGLGHAMGLDVLDDAGHQLLGGLGLAVVGRLGQLEAQAGQAFVARALEQGDGKAQERAGQATGDGQPGAAGEHAGEGAEVHGRRLYHRGGGGRNPGGRGAVRRRRRAGGRGGGLPPASGSGVGRRGGRQGRVTGTG